MKSIIFFIFLSILCCSSSTSIKQDSHKKLNKSCKDCLDILKNLKALKSSSYCDKSNVDKITCYEIYYFLYNNKPDYFYDEIKEKMNNKNNENECDICYSIDKCSISECYWDQDSKINVNEADKLSRNFNKETADIQFIESSTKSIVPSSTTADTEDIGFFVKEHETDLNDENDENHENNDDEYSEKLEKIGNSVTLSTANLNSKKITESNKYMERLSNIPPSKNRVPVIVKKIQKIKYNKNIHSTDNPKNNNIDKIILKNYGNIITHKFKYIKTLIDLLAKINEKSSNIKFLGTKKVSKLDSNIKQADDMKIKITSFIKCLDQDLDKSDISPFIKKIGNLINEVNSFATKIDKKNRKFFDTVLGKDSEKKNVKRKGKKEKD